MTGVPSPEWMTRFRWCGFRWVGVIRPSGRVSYAALVTVRRLSPRLRASGAVSPIQAKPYLVVLNQAAIVGGHDALLGLATEPLIVFNGGRQQVEGDMVDGAPVLRSQPGELCLKAGRELEVHASSAVRSLRAKGADCRAIGWCR